ncbi:MAG: class I SAM-dependent methyltransferase [Promethearchaeota archaeon]
MSCPQCLGIETTFNNDSAVKDLKKYQEKGPRKTTQFLIDFFLKRGVKGKSLLDIGGGVGIIQYELLKCGLDRAISVEASSAYSEVSKAEARDQGHAEKVEFYHGNYVDLAPTISSVDIVTLDRVVCCYPDMEQLVHSSINHAKEYYAVIYPHDKLWMRLGIAIVNFIQRIKRSNYRGFIHSKDAFHKIIKEHNFEQCHFQETLLWRIEIFKKKNGQLHTQNTTNNSL